MKLFPENHYNINLPTTTFTPAKALDCVRNNICDGIGDRGGIFQQNFFSLFSIFRKKKLLFN